ncbi:putative coiled-coil domain-containing protein 144C [Lemur catta]|uniref:putative coiled-coil domain-containing protein 144C n=1 Tax=Lemur catta TaxID=9447 RepID=UPI001E26D2A2|nr:putative coiled-coil domain-containing protein 144C [Lemur catta]
MNVSVNNVLDKMSALGPGQNEDAGSPRDLENISLNFPQNHGGDLCGSEVNKQKNTANGQVEAEEDLEVTSEDEQERHEESKNNQPQVNEREKHKSNKMAVSENLYDGAADDGDDDALLPERKSRKTESGQFPRMEKEVCDRPAKQTSKEKNKVKEQIHSMGDHNDLTWSSEMAPEDYDLPSSYYQHFMLPVEQLGMDCKDTDSASVLRMQDVVLSSAREIELKNVLCERLTGKSKKMANMVRVPQEENENMLLGQQLEGAENKANNKDKAVINVQDQLYDKVKNLQAQSGNQSLPVEERLNVLINEFNQVKERLYQHSKWEAEVDDIMESLENVCSRCHYLDAKNQVDQEELFSMKATQEQCEMLEKENMKLEKEFWDLKNHMQQMVDLGEIKMYKDDIEERATQDVVEKIKEVNLFLQSQAASEEYIEQIKEDRVASIRSQTEVTIKNLESEISNMKFSQGEVEKYNPLYQGELKAGEYLLKKAKNFRRTPERLAASSRNLVQETQGTGTCFPTRAMKTGTFFYEESPSVGTVHNGLGLHRELSSRENSMFFSSFPWTSDANLETYLTEVLLN